MFGDAAKPFEVKLETGPGGAAVWTMRDLEHVNERRAFELYDAGATVREVAEALGIPRTNAGRIRKRLGQKAGQGTLCPSVPLYSTGTAGQTS
jgi:hypothetical protein